MQFPTCFVYVDYEGLLVEISQYRYLDIDTLLSHLLRKIQKRYQVQKAVVFGSWFYEENQAYLTSVGYDCQQTYTKDKTIEEEVQKALVISTDTMLEDHATVFMLIGIGTYRMQLLRKINQAAAACIVWSPKPLSLAEQAFYAAWELIELPHVAVEWKQERLVRLHGLVLLANSQGYDENTTISLHSFKELLAQYQPFQQDASAWIHIALGEQILVPVTLEEGSLINRVQLNRSHPLVQQTLLIKNHIVTTLSKLLLNRDWIASSVLERTLVTSSVLNGQLEYCRAWLRLLIDLGIFLVRPVPQFNDEIVVTTLSLNRDTDNRAMIYEQQVHDLQRLILLISYFMIRKAQSATPLAVLLKCLMKTMTYGEAYALMFQAIRKKIISFDSMSGFLNTISFDVVVKPDITHDLVQSTLEARNQLLLSLHTGSFLAAGKVQEHVLIEEFCKVIQAEREEGIFWIHMLTEIGILVRSRSNRYIIVQLRRLESFLRSI